MSDFNKDYYLQNTIWARKFDPEKVQPRFSVQYGDRIYFHFELAYSLFKTVSKESNTRSVVVPVLNVCLRFYQRIKQLYPYNEVFVIIHADNLPDKYASAAKTLTDFLPNFAVYCKDNADSLEELDAEGNYHIVYGYSHKRTTLYPKSSGVQFWYLNMGTLRIHV